MNIINKTVNSEYILYAGLECPTHSTVFKGLLDIRGWIVLDTTNYNEISILDPSFFIEIENKSLDKNLSDQSSGNFFRMTKGDQKSALYLKELAIVDRREIVLKNESIKRFWYSIKGELLDELEFTNKSFNLRICAQFNDIIAYSHIGNITYSYTHPDYSFGTEHDLPSKLYDNVLVSKFWSVSKVPCKLRGEIDLTLVNGSRIVYSELYQSAYSPDLANIWPSCVNSRNARTSTLVILPETDATHFSYSYDLFDDLSSQNTTIGRIFMGNAEYSPKQWEARLEKIGIKDNILSIEGILWSELAYTPHIFIASSTEFKCLTLNKQDSRVYTEWFSLPEDDSMLGSRCWKKNNRFRINFPSDILGEVPGQIKLWYSLDGSSFTAFADKFTSSINIFVNDSLSEIYDNNASRSQKIRRKFSRNRLIKSKNLSLEKFTSGEVCSPTPSKILVHFHNLSATEGAPRVLYNIVNQCLPRSTFCLSARDGDLKRHLSELGIKTLLNPNANIIEQTNDRYQIAFEDYLKKFRFEKPELLIANSIDSFIAVDVAWRMKLPCIWIIHESITPSSAYLTLDPWIRRRYIKSLLKSDKVVFVSKETRDVYRGLVSDDRAVVIKNGIDFEFFTSELSKYDRLQERSNLVSENFEITERDIVFLSVGTTTERKGQDRTLRELKLFSEKRPNINWKFLIVGGRDIPFLGNLMNLISEYKLQRNVFVIPETKDIHKYYALSDYFILNSREESSPLVILEAMAAKLPIFSTDVFGVKEILSHKKNAMIFNGEVAGDLANVVSESLSNPQILHLVKQRAFVDVQENHSLDNSMSLYWSLISGYLNKTNSNNI